MRRAALLVAALTAGSTVLGLLRDTVAGAVFGASSQLDAWFVAQGVMNLALGLISGAMARSLTPTLARQATSCTDTAARPPVRSGRGGGHQHRTLDVAVTVTCLVLGIASLAIAVVAGPVVGVLAPGFTSGEHDLAVHLTRIVLLATLLVSGTNLLAGAAHAHGRFGWAGVQGVPFNLAMIVAAGVFGPRYGVSALAVGFVVGSGLRLIAQLVPMHRLRLRVRPSLDVRDPGFREICRMLPPLLLGSAITNVNQLVDRAVASTVGDGAISALSYGWRVINLPETIIVASLIVPLYPAIGAAAGDPAELRRLIHRASATVLTTLTLVTAVFLVAPGPFIAALFGYGAFGGDSVRDATLALRWYAPGLLVLGLGTVLIRASHALGDARTPTLVSLVAMAVNVTGSLMLGPVLGIRGIALATTLSFAVSTLLNTVMLRRHRAVDLGALGAVCSRVLPAGLVAGGVAALVGRGMQALDPQPIAEAGCIGFVSLTGYLLVLASLRSPELRLLSEVMRRRP